MMAVASLRLTQSAPQSPSLLQNIEAEQAVLGAILIDNSAIRTVARTVTADEFSEPVHRAAFEVTTRLVNDGKPATPATIAPFLGDQDLGGLTVSEYLGRLAGHAVTVASAGRHARLIADLAVRRQLVEVGNDIAAAAVDAPPDADPLTLMDDAERKLAELRPADPNPTLFDPWARFVVPPFPFETLPPTVRRFAEYTARTTGADAAAAGLTILTSLSGAVSHEFRLKMMRSGSWWVRPRLWTLLVGPPSARKTPIMSAATGPLVKRDHKASDHHMERLEAWEQEPVETRGKAPSKPARAVIGDVTVEKLGELLSRSKRGALVWRDELAGWIGAMEKYSGGGKGSAADRAFWLQAYDGGRYTVDRMGRETAIANCSVSLLGGIQPDRLRELGNLSSDGLLQRFCPVMMRQAHLPEDYWDPDAERDFDDLVARLFVEPAADLHLDEGGHAVRERIVRTLHELEADEAGLGSAFSGFVGKLGGVFGSLALLLHLVEGNSGCDRVIGDTADRAARIVTDFILPHGLAFFSQGDDAGSERLRAAASLILTKRKAVVVASDFTTNCRPLRGLGTFDLGRAISPLVAGGWLEPLQLGPTCTKWRVLPGVHVAFAHRAKTEEKRKGAVRRLILQAAAERS